MRFRKQHHLERIGERLAVAPATQTSADGVIPAVKDQAAIAEEGPLLSPGRRDLALKTQATGTDARAERLIRSVRMEIAEIREQMDTRPAATSAGYELIRVDLAAVCGNPERAAELPQALLVKALVEACGENGTLREEVRTLREGQAGMEGRINAFEHVIAALHGNIEDLRLARDRGPALESPITPRVLRPTGDTLAGAEQA